MLVHLTGIVCGLGAATLAPSLTGKRAVVALVIGFAVATVWLEPEPVWIGGLVVVVVVLRLCWPGFSTLSAVAAGTLAGSWGHILQSYGLTGWLAIPLAAAVPSTAVFLENRSPRFAPRAMREDALSIICVFALVLVAAPVMSAGWQSAETLNLEPERGTRSGLGIWPTLGLTCVVSLGGLHALWRRR